MSRYSMTFWEKSVFQKLRLSHSSGLPRDNMPSGTSWCAAWKILTLWSHCAAKRPLFPRRGSLSSEKEKGARFEMQSSAGRQAISQWRIYGFFKMQPSAHRAPASSSSSSSKREECFWLSVREDAGESWKMRLLCARLIRNPFRVVPVMPIDSSSDN